MYSVQIAARAFLAMACPYSARVSELCLVCWPTMYTWYPIVYYLYVHVYGTVYKNISPLLEFYYVIIILYIILHVSINSNSTLEVKLTILRP